jgi:SsrA-binding protein
MKTKGTKTIALNKRASHEYLLEERFEAGLVLEGWEVKAMREGHAQITDTFVAFKGGEPYIVNMHVPVSQHVAAHVSAHLKPEPDRSRKLLLHAKEINKLARAKEREGYSIIGTALYFKDNRVKLEIALGKGKKLHDKRQSDKDRDWKRQQGRIVKSTGR